MIDLDAQIRNSTAMLGMPWEGFLRLFVAAVASGSIGLERELRGRQAGLRTNILIALGAALAMMVSMSFAQRDWPHPAGFAVNVDPARVAYGVMTGMGLLCAGAIVKEGANVHGLTTAAALWCATAIGLSAGMGLYLLTIGTAIIAVIVLWLLAYIEQWLPRIKYVRITVRRSWGVDCISQTVNQLTGDGLRIAEVDFYRTPEGKEVDIAMLIGFSVRSRFFELAHQIEIHPDLNLISAQNL